MARNFDGSTDRIDYSSIQASSGQAMTFSCLLNLDAVAHTNYPLCIHTAGAPETRALLFQLSWNPPDWSLQLTGLTSGDAVLRESTANPFATGSYVNLIWTWDGSLTGANIHIYVNDSEVGYARTENGTGVAVAGDGTWSFGGVTYADNRNLDGKLADCGWWNRVLTSDERAILASRYSPRFIPNGLKFAPSLIRNPGDPISGQAGTLDGTTVSSHPRIILPQSLL